MVIRIVVLPLIAITLSACAKGFETGPWESGIPYEGDDPENQDLDHVDTTPVPAPGPAPGHTIYFAINRSPVKLAHGPAVTWLGCEKEAAVKGGYNSNTTCGRAYFHPRFEEQLNKEFFRCVEEAAFAADLSQPREVFVHHLGSYNDRTARGSSSLSMHAYARALDIAMFNLYDREGKITRISTNVRDYQGPTKIFYDHFRQCWREKMPSSCTSSHAEYKGSIGIPGSPLGGNSLHNDHIHLSLALCAG